MPLQPFTPFCKILLYFFFIVLVGAAPLSAQSLTIEQHDEKLKTLTEREKVDYILKNQYALYSADFDHGLALMQEAIAISKKNNWKDKEGTATMIEGVIHYLKGNFESALPSFLKSYQILDSLKEYNGLARLCNELGVFYRRQSDTQKAFHYLDEAEKFALKANNREALGTSYAHRAVLLDRENKLDEAATLYEKVYAIRRETGDSVGLGYALLDLSTVALRKGNLKKALDHIDESTRIRRKMGDKQGVAVNLVNTGETYYSVKDYRKAIQYFEECLALAIEIGYTDLIRYTYEQLSASHVQLNDFKNAFVYQQKGKTFSDSLYNIDKAKVIADLQTRFETEKKEQQILLQKVELSEQQAEIRQTYIVIGALIITVMLIGIILVLNRSRYKRQQELLIKEKEISVHEAYILASIQSQENERKRFAQDLHDGMGQLISALRLSLLSVNRDSSLEHRVTIVNKAEGLLNDMHREIRSIAFNLMPQTLVQHGLVPALKEMAERITSSGQILIRVSSFDVPERFTEVVEISLYRAIQEWINNVVKYSRARIIEVQLVGHDQEIAITIEDNGDGFDPSVLENSKGNGWKNIKSRLNLIKGAVDIDSLPERKSTTLILRVPVAKMKSSNAERSTANQINQ
jgi:two-component system, NarL family, sensor kinase